jgi:hypothetical protein
MNKVRIILNYLVYNINKASSANFIYFKNFLQHFIYNMSKLNKDVIFLVLKEFSNNRKFLHPCLLVNRTWCETAVPILWSNPYCRTDNAKNILFNVILLHLSEESRENLKVKKLTIL